MKRAKHTTFNSFSPGVNFLLSAIAGLFAFLCVYPMLLVVSASFSDEKALMTYGYRLIPKAFSLNAYRYILITSNQLVHSYLATILITVVGTLLGLTVVSMLAYALSRSYFKYRNVFSFLVFFTMIFSGGMVPSYIINTQYFHLTNTIWAIILPTCCTAFNVILLRTFFSSNVPDSLIESAKIDGAGEFYAFLHIVLPISGPGLATIALFLMLGYWNEWFNALLYINNNTFVPLQLLLMRIQNNLTMMQNMANMPGVQQEAWIQNLPSETARMAVVLFSVGPIVLAYPFFQRYFVKGMTIGAVKG